MEDGVSGAEALDGMSEQIIDVALWNRATWKGVLYAVGMELPKLVLVFQNRDAATEIFGRWQEIVGNSDDDERIRISIIEGQIPSQPPGYTMHIGPSLDHIRSTAMAANSQRYCVFRDTTSASSGF